MKPKQHMRIPFTRSASQSAILLALTSALFLLFTADASSWSVEGSESAPRFGHSSSDLQFTDESDLVFERGDSAAPGAGGIILNAGSDDNQDGDLDDDRDDDKVGPTRTPRPSQSPTMDDDDDLYTAAMTTEMVTLTMIAGLMIGSGRRGRCGPVSHRP